MSLKHADLSSFDTVFCDSKDVLEQAWAGGLSRGAKVLSSSPTLLCEGLAEPVHGHFDASRRKALNDSTFDLSLQVFEKLKGHPALDFYAALVARLTILLQPSIAQAASLCVADFDEPRAVLLPHVDNAASNRLFRSRIADFLTEAPNAEVFTFPVSMQDNYLVRGGKPPGLGARIRQASIEKMAFRFFTKLGRFIPRSVSKGRVFVFSENELLMEAAAWLGGMGFALMPLPSVRTTPLDSEVRDVQDLMAALEEALRPALVDHVSQWVHEKIVDQVVNGFLATVQEQFAICVAGKKPWADELDRLGGGTGDVVLMNYPGGGAALSLISQCRERGIPVVAFEHGATRQFCDTHQHMQAAYENSFADWVMAFGTLGAKLSNATPFAYGVSIPVGLPKDYSRKISHAPEPGRPEILFVSTSLYIGNVQSLSGSLTDEQSAQREISIINDVLARVPHRVTFKPYPSVRYADPDPIHVAAQNQDNIEFYHSGFDLRYEIGKYRVLVTSRATSTVSWCLLSEKPLVFIDYEDHMPLTPEARKAFRAGTFFFETRNEGWLTDLQAFLSLPVEEIESRWAKKKQAHAELIRNFIALPSTGSGRRAASYIGKIAKGVDVVPAPGVASHLPQSPL